jgi:hypothetical protein
MMNRATRQRMSLLGRVAAACRMARSTKTVTLLVEQSQPTIVPA